MIEVKLLLSANRKSYMPHQLAQQPVRWPSVTLNGHFTHPTLSLQQLNFLLLLVAVVVVSIQSFYCIL